MKIRILPLVLLFFMSINLSAQDSALLKIPVADSSFHRHIISVGLGQSYWPAELRFDSKWRYPPEDKERDLAIEISPVYQLAYDYQIKKLVSIGLTLSHQKIELTNYFKYDNEPTRVLEQDISTQNIALRTLFHYGTPRLSMYSGFSMGYQRTRIQLGAMPDKPKEPILLSDVYSPDKDMISIQLTLFGLRAWLTDNIAFRTEFCFGFPNYSSAGLSVRF